LFIIKGVRERLLVGCTLWQSFGISVGSWGFGPALGGMCNVGGVSFFFFCGGKKKPK